MHKITYVLILIFVLFISNPGSVVTGASCGLSLWATTLVPALFPVTVISHLIIKHIDIKPVFIYPFIILAGILGGFPLCAILCSQQSENKYSTKLCQYIMAFCNISSPAFVLNYICSRDCVKEYDIRLTLTLIYLPSIILLIIFLIRINALKLIKAADKTNYLNKLKTSNNLVDNEVSKKNVFVQFNQSVYAGIESMLKLCGIVVIFSTLTPFIINLKILPTIAKCILSSLLEITSGILVSDSLYISGLADSRLTYIIVITANAFGGLSTIMQTFGMIYTTSLSIKKYIYHKTLLAALTCMLSIFMIYVLKF